MQLKNDKLDSISESVATSAKIKLTPVLRQMAQNSAWPASLISKLTVDIGDEYEVYVDYPEQDAKEIEDLEYGTPFQNPNAVIRPFMLRAQAWIAGLVQEEAMDELLEMSGIF